MSLRQRLSPERGFSLLNCGLDRHHDGVTGAIFSMVNPSHGNARSQPEVSDIQQRMRVGSDTLFKELMMGGAGPYFGARTGSLLNFFAPIVPRRMGLLDADAPRDRRAVYRSDTLTLTYIPNSYSQTSIAQTMPPQAAELKVTYPPNCQVPRELCGFEIGMTVLIFDDTGHWDTFTLTQVQNDAAHVQHRGQGLTRYEAGRRSQAVSRPTTSTRISWSTTALTETPIVDNVVASASSFWDPPADDARSGHGGRELPLRRDAQTVGPRRHRG